MGSKVDYIRKKFVPLLDKTLQNALAHRIGKEFPRIGGYRIRGLCAEILLEVVTSHLRPLEHLQHGQVLWFAVHRDHPPARHQRIADSELVPVILDLSTPADIESRIGRKSSEELLRQKAVRLCEQACQQNGVLSNCDLAELLCTSDSRISRVLSQHEEETGKLVPRRATLHDVGTCMTHKRIICMKRYADGKDAPQVARETYHSIESVDRYLGQYDRVRHCRLEGLTPHETAHALGCGESLVEEYLKIDFVLEKNNGCGQEKSRDNATCQARGQGSAGEQPERST
ncbi:MAG: DUF1670 domain-containing protein [Planctomycetota bacterium]|nr:DUF1670 domain-containing protein [Planctomycetota bacterium]